MDKQKKMPGWFKALPVIGSVAGAGIAWLQKKDYPFDYLMYAGIGGVVGFTPIVAFVLSNKEVSNETSAMTDKERMKKEILASARLLEPNMKDSEAQAYKNILDGMTEDQLKIGYLTMKMQQDEKRLTKIYPSIFTGQKSALFGDPKEAAIKLKQFAAIAQKEYGIELTANPDKFIDDIKQYFQKLMGGSFIEMMGGKPVKQEKTIA